MWHDILLWEVEIPVFILSDHGVYLVNISKRSFSLIDPIEGMSYVTQRFMNIRLVLCHIYKIYYYLYVLEYYTIIFN